MSGMLERVARAIYESEWEQSEGCRGPGAVYDLMQKVERRYFEAMARAALMAMREYPMEMFLDGDVAENDHPVTIWRKMIDAILNEPPCPDAPGGVAQP